MKYKYPFTNAIVFALVMRDPELSKGLLQMIFPDRKIENIKLHEESLDIEKTIIATIESRKVRLDVLFEDEKAWYDIELQVRDENNLANRTRYTHAIMDVYALKAGQDFNELKKSYVIFLCCFDPFKLGEPVYRFSMKEEKNNLSLGDDSFTIILNSKASVEKTPKMFQELFEYMNESTVPAENRLLQQIDNSVKTWNTGEGVSVIMTLEQEILIKETRARKEGREEGMQEGEANATRKIAIRLLQSGMLPKEVARATELSEAEVSDLM